MRPLNYMEVHGNESEIEVAVQFSKHVDDKQIKSEKQVLLDHKGTVPTWNDYSLRSIQQPLDLFTFLDNSTKSEPLGFDTSEDISIHKGNDHPINMYKPICGLYSASSQWACGHTPFANHVSSNCKQIKQQNQPQDIYTNDAHHCVYSNIISASVHFNENVYKSINNNEQVERRLDQNGSEEKEEYTPFNDALNSATYSWMKPKDDKGKNNLQRRIRQSYTREQLLECEKQFHTTPYVTKEILKGLAQRINLTERQVKVWFQNRRMKQKREKMSNIYQKVQNHHHLSSFGDFLNHYQPAQNASSSKPKSSANATITSIESGKSIDNVQQYKILNQTPPIMQPILQSQQRRCAERLLQPSVPAQSSQFVPSQLQTINTQITSEHNQGLHLQLQQHAHWQPQDVIQTQLQPIVQPSFIQLQQQQQQQPISQQLQQSFAHALSQSQMIAHKSSIMYDNVRVTHSHHSDENI